MSKAIVVYDIPEGIDLSKCKTVFDGRKNLCIVRDEKGSIIGNFNEATLKYLPNKRKMPKIKPFNNDFIRGKVVGWNECLDEILGEEECG